MEKFCTPTYYGHIFNYLNPDPDSIDIRDIARSLARQKRFLGHIEVDYTVGQHVICVAQNLALMHNGNYMLQFAGIMHDSQETYYGDVPSPLKCTDALKGYRELEDIAQAVIFEKFGIVISEEEYTILDRVDKLVGKAEAIVMLPNYKEFFKVSENELSEINALWTDFREQDASEIEKEFLEAFYLLSEKISYVTA